MTETRRSARVIIALLILAALILFAVFLLPPLIVLILPFILAFFIAKVIEPLVSFLNRKLKIPKRLASAVTVVIVVALLIWIIVSIVGRIFSEIKNLIEQADVISEYIVAILSQWEMFVESYLGESIAGFINDYINAAELGKTIAGYITGYIEPTFNQLLSIVKSLPNIIVFIVALILGTYFMSSDSELVSQKLSKLIPQKARAYFRGMRTDMSHALVGYIRAQLILMLITFVECTIGFVFIGGNLVNYALLLALAISIIDALPILGTGTVLIPWSLISFISGNTRLGIGLLVLYLVCLGVRQLLEPRIVGQQIGVHPLATLMTMYIGLKTIGFIGMILGPVLMLIIKNLSDSGLFKIIGNLIWYGQNGFGSFEDAAANINPGGKIHKDS